MGKSTGKRANPNEIAAICPAACVATRDTMLELAPGPTTWGGWGLGASTASTGFSNGAGTRPFGDAGRQWAGHWLAVHEVCSRPVCSKSQDTGNVDENLLPVK